jgi:type III pantothenate kinase
MTPDVVVDIGNSRMKWGRVTGGAVAEMVSLSLTDEREWDGQRAEWSLGDATRWAVAGVNPGAQKRFESWAGADVFVISSYRQLPVTVAVDRPELVGIDRLLNAVAAKSSTPVIIVSVGTAVTIDLVGGTGTFFGGAILPGPRLMAKSLTQNTAALPEIVLTEPASALPGQNTVEAIKTGVFWAVMSAINGLRASFAFEPRLEVGGTSQLPVVLTGGDHGLFVEDMKPPFRAVPTLTLEGIRIVSEELK